MFQNFPGTSDPLSQVSKFQHRAHWYKYRLRRGFHQDVKMVA